MQIFTISGRFVALALAAGLGLSFCGVTPASAATTRTVNKLTDGTGVCDAADCTLREAINASVAGDTIRFSVSGSIMLTLGELGIGRDLNITGPADGSISIERKATAAFSRIFNVSAGTVKISNLTVTNGYLSGTPGLVGTPSVPRGGDGGSVMGAGILNAGTLTLTRCSITDNYGVGGVGGDGYNGDSAGKGGNSAGAGIANSGSLTLSRCTVSGNLARGGAGGIGLSAGSGGSGSYGGIINTGALVMVNTTVYGNTAQGGRGGESSSATNGDGGEGGDAGAGGVGNGFSFQDPLASPPSLAATNCTISLNTVYGGNGGRGGTTGFSTGGDGGNALAGGLLLRGGFGSNSNSETLRNTIVALNDVSGGAGGPGSTPGVHGSPGGPDDASFTNSPDVDGNISSLGHNLVGKSDGSDGWVASDLLGSIAAPLDPQLNALNANGGLTQTILLLPGSAAINTGDDAVLSAPLSLATDQRDLPRKIGTRVDIGATEFDSAQTSVTLVVNTLAEHADGTCGALDCTLLDAINAANAASNANTITFKAGLSGTITNTLLPDGLELQTPVTISGPGARILSLSGGGIGRVFWVQPGGSATISGLTLTNSGVVGSGGAIFNQGTLTLRACAVLNNRGGSGGGVANAGTLNVFNCTFAGNSSTGNGGAVRNTGTAKISNSTLWNNIAVSSGAITSSGTSAAPAKISLDNCTIAGNIASAAGAYGGGINNYGVSTVELGNTIVANNTATNGSDLSGAFVSLDYNLIRTFQAAYASFTGSTSNSQFNQDPKLSVSGLRNNGGPTDTLALASGSPAIDKGKSFGATTDQRGFNRPVNIVSLAPAPGGDDNDIGAYEVGGVPTLVVNNPRSTPEGSASVPGSITFDITLSGASLQTVTVAYQTTNGINNPALAGSDYVAKSGTLNFAPGETLKRVTILYVGDSKGELNETFFLDLKTPTNATIADNRGVGTIVNDDAAGQLFENDETPDTSESDEPSQ